MNFLLFYYVIAIIYLVTFFYVQLKKEKMTDSDTGKAYVPAIVLMIAMTSFAIIIGSIITSFIQKYTTSLKDLRICAKILSTSKIAILANTILLYAMSIRTGLIKQHNKE